MAKKAVSFSDILKAEISAIPDKKAELLKIIEEINAKDPSKIESLLYFAKLWTSGGDPERKIWETKHKDLRSLEAVIRRSGPNAVIQSAIEELKKELIPLDAKYGVE